MLMLMMVSFVFMIVFRRAVVSGFFMTMVVMVLMSMGMCMRGRIVVFV